MYRIGVDVGGTNTDAAIVDITAADSASDRGVRASNKTPTTVDVTSGIHTVIEKVLADSQVDRKDVLSVSIGTTHFVNAVVQADSYRLNKVAVVRLCGPFTKRVSIILIPCSIYPFLYGCRLTWANYRYPRSSTSLQYSRILWEVLSSTLMEVCIHLPENCVIGGNLGTMRKNTGLEIDGREIRPLVSSQIGDAVRKIREAGVKTIALVSVFSPLDHQGIHEDTCKKMMLELDPSLSIVCSHSIGGVGMLTRENATILNASILQLARRTVRSFCLAMSKLQLDCPLFLTQNDGTLTEASTAAEYPIKTFASGPTNSMTGAAFLASLDKTGDSATSQETQVLVVDVGGTTSDICALLPSGFPRQAPNYVHVGGVRTAFSMPEVLSVGLGGGSRISYDEKNNSTRVGPDSVGHYLTTKAMVFGGDEMTSTDIVVASGAAQIGDTSKVSGIPSHIVSQARAQIKKILERAVDSMKVSELPVTLLLVGGGSIVQMDALEGVTKCIMPPHYDSANAVGAAIAKVTGEVDIIEILEGRNEKDVLDSCNRKALDMAISKGADPDDVKIVQVDKIPLQYVTNKATRFVIKAVGKLSAASRSKFEPGKQISNMDSTVTENGLGEEDTDADYGEANGSDGVPKTKRKEPAESSVKYSVYTDIEEYKPEVRNNTWYVSVLDLEFIATGAGVLGTGGGGPAYLQYLECLEHLNDPETKGRMRIIAPEAMKDSDLCVFAAWFGAPSVADERMSSGTEMATAVDFSVKSLGLSHFEAVLADEIGGMNGMSTFPTSAHYDIPVVDGDFMGRAYPTLAHCKESTLNIYIYIYISCGSWG